MKTFSLPPILSPSSHPLQQPQILQPSSRCLSELLLLRGRPVRTPPTAGRSDDCRVLKDLPFSDPCAPADPGEMGQGTFLARPASRSRTLQPLSLRKHPCLTVPRPGGAIAATTTLGPPIEQARQLPPPSRGLPSFSLSRTSLLQRTTKSHGGALEPEQVPPPHVRSCLPKPKTP